MAFPLHRLLWWYCRSRAHWLCKILRARVAKSLYRLGDWLALERPYLRSSADGWRVLALAADLVAGNTYLVDGRRTGMYNRRRAVNSYLSTGAAGRRTTLPDHVEAINRSRKTALATRRWRGHVADGAKGRDDFSQVRDQPG